ncbi:MULTISPECIES: sulfatase [Aliiglaciecola]|uniref:sulfatase n=1 Tax=Aliiglaciecola TaxID=1406885 RepID=UPI001C09330C|nr:MULTISPECIES: sulfatase [Aliiglaciecola]MBU2877917.1 sulfatase [Aliiglaciecola lipolytica]MDO6709281.1 sulfatase [Aliiglaciecola sp. 2_MG-2023]MDO6750429.1 sulfatase [Aliiglaciecola sp. 1_MG-2023]
MYKLLGLIAIVLLSQSAQANTAIGKLEKPNIIIFYVDDLGWQDTQLNDIDKPTPWETPNMLALAKRGMNFTQAYSPAPTCAPSRGGLLSGQHPAKTNFTHVLGAQIPAALNNHNQLIAPYFNDHLSPETLTLAEALKANGYKTGHVGKWHLGNYASNYPKAYGFDFSFDKRGAHKGSKQRHKDFDNKEFPLSKEKYPPYSEKNPNGISYPLDLVTENALGFVQKNKDEPFFLYLAHWMVHVPIITKNKALLEHYTDKLGIPFPQSTDPITTPGQTNPYYGAMVTTVDWSLGRLVSLLEQTDDPRNPGKKLIDTTYIFFSSDNGGAERKGTEIITDNFPLDKGKKHTEEGGIRVPMLVAGPGVKSNVTHHGMVNQLDYYPTILALTDSTIPEQYKDKLSGLNLSTVLQNENQKASYDNGEVRKNLFWHFPHNEDPSMRGAIREGDFKLYKHYVDNSYSLYRLYEDDKRYDLEETNDLAAEPEYAGVVKTLSANLEQLLAENNAIYPRLNPENKDNMAARTLVPEVSSNKFNKAKREAQISLVDGKTAVKEAYLLAEIAKTKGSNKRESRGKLVITYEKLPVTINSDDMTVTGYVPKDRDAYVFVLIDENNFLVTSDKYKSL